MGKTRNGDKEYSRLQEALHENKKLKRENASLRKQLARIDLDRYSHVRDILQEHYANEKEEISADKALENLKSEWRCNHCTKGYLEIILYGRAGETWYFRKCNSCPHRTKSQKYAPSVKGIISKSKTE